MKMRVPGEKLSDGLAWLAFLLAVIGGFAATSSFIGDLFVAGVHIGPWWLPLALGVVGFLFIIGDLIEDGVPDRLRTVYITILWPSTWLAIEGKFGKLLNSWIVSMNKMLDSKLAVWVSDNPKAQGTIMTGVAAVAISFAVVWAHRYAKKKNATNAGTPVATRPVATRRGR
jgi:hypothetical protein